MPHLFDPITLRGVTLRNRVAVSPMCEYSSHDGFATDWHLVHLGSRAVGGAGLVVTEACAVVQDGRISPEDLGIYRDGHVEKLAQIAAFIHEQGAVAGIQLAHAGRKASTARPWETQQGYVTPQRGGWEPLAPSAIAFASNYGSPRALTHDEIGAIPDAFATAAKRALAAGFRVIELHAAHGYLFHEFLSPLCNERTDEYGGSYANRSRILRETAAAVRAIMPEAYPLFVRISASDWAPGGWDIESSIALARDLKALGVDLIDASSGGAVEHQRIDLGPGYQVPFAERIKREAGIATGAVGLITNSAQADEIVHEGRADIVSLARELLRDPYWPLRAASELGIDIAWHVQYQRAKRVPVSIS
jgi:2,4-dienoyl-CoA reductase-like NADH-dependent reductase (Old Yellow Enzyme family)